jgi:putative SOS response-associated peptidase YedK
MCGHFTQSYTWRELVELYRLTQPARNLQPRYNIAPTTVIDTVKWYCLCLKFDAIDLLALSTMSYSCRGMAKLYGT